MKRLLFLLLGWALGCINSPTPTLVPMPPREPTALEWPAAAENAQQADGVFVAKIVEMKPDWTYDDPCGLVAIALKKCDGTVAYRVKLANGERSHYVWAFTPAYGVFGLYVGEEATYLWHRTVAYKYSKCRQQQAVAASYCDYDLLDAFQSDFDVLPIADSAVVANLRRKP